MNLSWFATALQLVEIYATARATGTVAGANVTTAKAAIDLIAHLLEHPAAQPALAPATTPAPQ